MLRKLLPNVYEGWLVVGSSAFIITIIGAVFFYGFGTIFNPVIEEFGWSVAATSLAFSLRQETSGIVAPFIGMAIDRVGPRRVLFFGIVIVSAGVVLMSLMQNIWHFYASMVVIAIGTSSAGGQVGLVATATWFEERRARAMSLVTIGGGIAGVFVIFVAFLVESLGWRGALRLLAVIMMVFGSLAAANVRARPRGHPQPLDGLRRRRRDDELEGAYEWGVPVLKAIRSRAFAMLAIALVASGFATTALIVNQIPFLESLLGVSKGAAGATVAVFTVTSIVGRLGLGYLADKHSKRVILAAALALSAGAIPLLAFVQELWRAVLVLMLIAPGFGGSIPVRPALLADYFGTKYFGALNGVSSLVMTFGAFLGPLTLGVLVDQTGGYTVGWLLSGLVGLIAVPAALAAKPPAALMAEYGPRAVPAEAAGGG